MATQNLPPSMPASSGAYTRIGGRPLYSAEEMSKFKTIEVRKIVQKRGKSSRNIPGSFVSLFAFQCPLSPMLTDFFW